MSVYFDLLPFGVCVCGLKAVEKYAPVANYLNWV